VIIRPSKGTNAKLKNSSKTDLLFSKKAYKHKRVKNINRIRFIQRNTFITICFALGGLYLACATR
jgi:hypothetical protein